MIDEKTLLCIPFLFKDDIYVYPPTVREVVSNELFQYYRQLLTINQEDITDAYKKSQQEKKKPEENELQKQLRLQEQMQNQLAARLQGKIIEEESEQLEEIKIPTPFQYLMQLATDDKMRLIISKGIEFFIHKPCTLLVEEQIILLEDIQDIIDKKIKIEDISTITEENFSEFQNLIRKAVGDKPPEKIDPKEDARKARARALARERDRVKAKQAAKKGEGISFSTSLVSLCCMGIGITPLNIGELSYAAVSALIRTFQEKDTYETQVRSLQAGASPKKVHPKYWIRNIND